MKKIILMSFLSTCFLNMFAQRVEDENQPFYHWGFANRYNQDEDTPAYCLADKVNVREKPDAKASVLTTLPIGTEVTILEKSEKPPVYTSNGLEAPFLKVQFSQNGKNQTGYVWGGLLTHVRIQSQEDKNLFFLIGPGKVQSTKKHGYMDTDVFAQIRAVKEYKELSKLEFITNASVEHVFSGNTVGKHGISGVKDALILETSGQACGEANIDILLFWDGKKLQHVATNTSMTDVPMFYNESWIFPTEEGGKPNQLLWKSEGGEYDDAGTPQVDKGEGKTFIWNGAKLVEKK